MTAVMIIIIIVMVMVMEGPPTLIITPAHRIEQNLGNRGQTQGPDILVKIYLTWGRRRRVEKLMLKTDAMPGVLMDPRRHRTFLSVNHPKRRLFNELFIFGEVSKTLAEPGSS